MMIDSTAAKIGRSMKKCEKRMVPWLFVDAFIVLVGRELDCPMR